MWSPRHRKAGQVLTTEKPGPNSLSSSRRQRYIIAPNDHKNCAVSVVCGLLHLACRQRTEQKLDGTPVHWRLLSAPAGALSEDYGKSDLAEDLAF
jgi:hypothetical protein